MGGSRAHPGLWLRLTLPRRQVEERGLRRDGARVGQGYAAGLFLVSERITLPTAAVHALH